MRCLVDAGKTILPRSEFPLNNVYSCLDGMYGCE